MFFQFKVPKARDCTEERNPDPFHEYEENLLTPSDHICPKHTNGGALGVAHVVELLLFGFLYDKIDCGWKVIFSHLIQTAKGKNKTKQKSIRKNPSLF